MSHPLCIVLLKILIENNTVLKGIYQLIKEHEMHPVRQDIKIC